MNINHRVSVADDGKFAMRCKAFLNDEDVTNRCTAADPVEGWVDLYRVDEAGKMVLSEDTRRKPIFERHFGEVRVELAS